MTEKGLPHWKNSQPRSLWGPLSEKVRRSAWVATAPGSGQPPETRSAASGFPGFRALPAFLELAGFWRPSWAELAAGRAEPAGGLEAPTGRRLGAGLGGGTAAWVGRTRGPTGACARATCSAGNREGAWGGGGAGRYRAAAQEAGHWGPGHCRLPGIGAAAGEVYPLPGPGKASSGHPSHCGPQIPALVGAAEKGHLGGRWVDVEQQHPP